MLIYETLGIIKPLGGVFYSLAVKEFGVSKHYAGSAWVPELSFRISHSVLAVVGVRTCWGKKKNTVINYVNGLFSLKNVLIFLNGFLKIWSLRAEKAF